MSREPCMTLTDLAKEKGHKYTSTFNNWASRKLKLPDPVQMKGFSNNTGKKYYKRSELLAWYERAKPIVEL